VQCCEGKQRTNGGTSVVILAAARAPVDVPLQRMPSPPERQGFLRPFGKHRMRMGIVEGPSVTEDYARVLDASYVEVQSGEVALRDPVEYSKEFR
jgi:hypothetical protein